MNKKICILLVILLLSSLLSGCFDRQEADEMTYVIAIGLDKGKTNVLKMTLQYAVPTAVGGGGQPSGGGGENKSLSNLTLDCPTLYAGLNMANNFVGRQVNLSHAKVLVFSKELAESGDAYKYIYAIVRGREFRPNIYIAISTTSAEDYIKSISPIQELNPAKYYELKFSSYKYTGFTANTELSSFYFHSKAGDQQPVVILVGAGKYKSPEEFDPKKSTYTKKERENPLGGDYIAGNLPKTGDVEGEAMGLAVFDGDKMVGELDGQETTYYLLARGEYIRSYISIPDPLKKKYYVILNMKQNRKPIQKVEMVDGKPKISLILNLEADYLAIQSGFDYESDEGRNLFEKTTQDFLKKEVLAFLMRTAKEFKSDICGFGRSLKSKFLTWDEWENFKWLSKYKESTFNVEVKLKIRRPGLIIRSNPATSSEGKVE